MREILRKKKRIFTSPNRVEKEKGEVKDAEGRESPLGNNKHEKPKLKECKRGKRQAP